MSLHKHTATRAGTDGATNQSPHTAQIPEGCRQGREGAEPEARMTLRRQIEEVLDKHEPCLTQVQMTWLRLDPAHRHRKQMYGSRRGKGGGVNQELGTNICTLLYIKHGEGNGNPLQDSCLENPMDREAWQAAVYGVARVGHDRATKKAHTHIYKTINKDLLHSIGNYIQCFVIIYKGKESEICACVYIYIYTHMGFPGGASGKELASQSRRHKRCRFDPWVEISWRSAWKPTAVFLLAFPQMEEGA